MRLLLVLASTLGSVALAGPSDAESEAAARRVLADPDYQLELPTDAPRPEAEAPRRVNDDPGSASTNPADPDFTGRSFAVFLWYLLVVVVIVALLLWLGRGWMDAKQRNLRVPAPAAAPAPARQAEPDLPDPGRLAAAGRYDEAVHAVLLVALHEIHRRAGSLAPAWTSREILYRIALPPEARDSLEEIVRAVERSRFGGAAVGEAEYAACARQAEACRASLPEKAA